MKFYELDGAGNRFILKEGEEPASVSELCIEHNVDGFILLEKSDRAAARMLFFNPNGQRAALCGNGLRCTARFLMEQGLKAPFVIESESDLHSICTDGDLIGAQMPQPSTLQQIELEGVRFLYTTVAVPHAYHLVEDVAGFDLQSLGERFVAHPFFPEGCNINILSIGNVLHLRTFERGVNRETRACGTGAVGAAFVSGKEGATICVLGGKLQLRKGWLFGPTSAPVQVAEKHELGIKLEK